MAVDIWPTDRADAAEDRWTTMAHHWNTDGVYGGFIVTATGTGMNIQVSAGEANVNGQHCKMDSVWNGSFNPGGSVDRQDAVYLQVNKAIPATAEIKVVQGTPLVPESEDANTADRSRIFLGYADIYANRTNLALTDVQDGRDFVRGRRFPGEIGLFAMGQYISGSLPCDGSSYAKFTYPELWVQLKNQGGIYGSTATTFQVPDYRNRFLLGSPTFGKVGMSGGADRLTAPNQLPFHSHYVANSSGDIVLISPGGSQANYTPAGSGNGLSTTYTHIGGVVDGKNTPGQAGEQFLPPYAFVQPVIFY